MSFTRLPPLPDGARPSLDEFADIADTAYARLPKMFRDMCGDVVMRVMDWPDAETLQALGIDSRYGLLGLYQGVSLDRKSTLDTQGLPDMVFLYRRPILQYAAEEGDSPQAVITHVLVHEIGHHFGLSDDDMERIENAAGS